MPESTQTDSVVQVNFDNLALKRWLHSIGPVRRHTVLRKLKADLQNLGLTRRQVHRGLIQLATKPRVVLTRQPLHERYRLKILQKDEGSAKIFDENERNRINLNLNYCNSEKAGDYIKSEVYRKVDTNYMKSDVDNTIDTKLSSVTNKNEYSKCENSENVLGDTETTKIEEIVHKRKSVISDSGQRKKLRIPVNDHKKIDRKKRKKLKNKFRTYFGNCESISEDEQERDILQKRFKRKRKKDSVDSCDSGVCITEVNTAISRATVLKDIQKTILDSTINKNVLEKTTTTVHTINESEEGINSESIEIIDQLKDVTNIIEVETKLQSNMNNVLTGKEKISQKEVVISDRDTVIKSTDTSSNIGLSQVTEQPKVNILIAETETGIRTDDTLSSDIPYIYISDHDIEIINKNSLEFQENNLNITKLNELLHMNFTESCQITSNGNILSIQENVKEDIIKDVTNKNESSSSKKLSGTHTNYNENVKEEVVLPNCIEKDNNIDLNNVRVSFDTTKDVELISINNTHNIVNNENESTVKELELQNTIEKKDIEFIYPLNVHNAVNIENESTVQESELNSTSEKKGTECNKVTQGKLRVLSSAELGSRWCPTPINSVTSQFSYKNKTTVSEISSESTTSVATLVSQTIPATVSVPAPTASIETTASENMKKSNIDPQFSESVYVTFVKIFNLIQSIRVSATTNLNYDKLLYIEFEKLRKVLNTENYIELTEGVVCILNRELSVTPSLSLTELFRYTPIIKSLYVRTSLKLNMAVNNLNERMTLNQNIYCNPQGSQNKYTNSSVQSRLQHLLSVPIKQTSINATSKQSQQNVQEKMILQSNAQAQRQNVLQDNTFINSITTNNHNKQQHNCQIQAQRTLNQQKISSTHFSKQNPVINMHATQGFFSHSSLPSTGTNHQGKRHVSMPATNAPFVGQHIPQINKFYNVNVPNYSAQQNMNSTHVNMQNVVVPPATQQYQNVIYRQPIYSTPQGIQLQSTSHVPLNYIPKSVPTFFAVNVPHSVPNSRPQNDQMHQKVSSHVPIKVPQNHLSEKMSSSKSIQNNHSCKSKQAIFTAKKKQNVQVSLESTTKMFDVLKYLSDIQKLMLLKQIDFYFSCTTWLQQQFTSEQWRKINLQRSFLLHFQTLLKHLVEKTMKDLLPNKSQANTFATNILTNIKIDVPKVVQIIVKENEGIHCQVEVSKGNQEQYTTNMNQDCITHQDLNVVISENQFDKEQEATDKSQDTELPNHIQESDTLNEEKIQKNKTFQKTVQLQKDNSPVKLSIESETLDIDVYQKHESEKDNLNMTNQHIKELQKMNDAFQIDEDVSVTSEMKISTKDTLHQLNPHLFTVEISSNNDQVTVIDTNVNGNKLVKEELKEHEEHQEKKLHITNTLLSSKNTDHEVLPILSPATPNNVDTSNCFLEEIVTSHIADVRSISIEAFEKLGETNNVLTNPIEGYIEEEEIKICLYCGKPSTVVCSVCLEAKYCSKICSELHWENHYKDCRPVERSLYL